MFEKSKPTFSSHINGTTTVQWNQFPVLSEFFNLITTSEDELGQTVITAMESKQYPIYGTQFHPEVILYRQGPIAGMIRDYPSRRMTELLSFFFVEETRKNNHKFESYEDEVYADIFNMDLRYYYIEGTNPSINAYFYK